MPLNILFFGTSQFAVPILQKLIDKKKYRLIIITQPDKPAGRKQSLTPSPIKKLAVENDLFLLQPDNLTVPNLKLPTMDFDLIVTASYGKIIPGKILDIPKFGALNVHPSLLPKYRGPSPIQNAILNGDKETGVTIMLMDEKMDHGPIIAQEKSFSLDSNYIDLHDKLAHIGGELLIRTIPLWIKKEIMAVPQNEMEATYTKIIKKEDGKINWQKTAQEIIRQIKAFNPWPGCWSILNGKRVKIITAILSDYENKNYTLGQIIKLQNKKMAVACGQGFLEIPKLQVEGKKPMSGEEFLNGLPMDSKFQLT